MHFRLCDNIRKACALTVGVLLMAGCSWVWSSAWGSELTGADWAEIGRVAGTFVNAETCPDTLPFRQSPKGNHGGPLVFIHYFPFFQISFDNKVATSDQYSLVFLSRQGEGEKFSQNGGFLRERPLPAGPWPQPYWRDINEAIDILRAQRIGADGFGYDLGSLPGTSSFDKVQQFCEIAAHVAPGFRFLIEPDMVMLKPHINEATLVAAVDSLSKCPAVGRTADGSILLIPFAPETMPGSFWQNVMGLFSRQGQKVALVPDFVSSLGSANQIAPLAYGITQWGQRDPGDVLNVVNAVPSLRPGQIWIQPVAPQDARPKDLVFWEASNTEMFRDSWMEALSRKTNGVQIITWNDYSELTEIAPSTGTQFLFYDLSAYYISWFKDRRPPQILRDAIFYDYRPAIFDPDHPADPTERPFQRLGKTPTQNFIEMLAMLTAPSTLEIDIGQAKYDRSFNAGLAVMRIPAVPGTPTFSVHRGGKLVATVDGLWKIAASSPIANPVYFGGSGTRIPVLAGVFTVTRKWCILGSGQNQGATTNAVA